LSQDLVDVHWVSFLLRKDVHWASLILPEEINPTRPPPGASINWSYAIAVYQQKAPLTMLQKAPGQWKQTG
jgi:hypothetical protein